MVPTEDAVRRAAQARQTALVGLLRHGAIPEDDLPRAGLAQPAVLRAEGPDAASFLHSQLTNEVQEVEPGAGNLNARVSRTGHLQDLFSLHRPVPPRGADPDAFVLLADRLGVQSLRDGLDAMLFSDDLTLTLQTDWHWLAIQGPEAAALLDAVFGPLGFEPWSTLPEHGIRAVRRARSSVGASLPPGCLAIRRSLTGDTGFLVGLPAGAPEATAAFEALSHALAQAAEAVGAEAVDAPAFAEALDILRIEAGQPRVGPETTPKRRLLPETGLEQSAVSYTKGCYLGQEVIARVRTYGSVPFLLRALVLDTPTDAYDDAARAALARFPAPGETLVDATTGKKLGAIASRTFSPLLGAPVAFAYLGRKVRTPGHTVQIETPDGPLHATVALLPLYSAPDQAAKVQQLYDTAIRTFADGHPSKAMDLLSEALSLDPTYADAYEAIGVILGRGGQYHEAIDFFRRLEEVAPDEPMVNTNLSLYYMKLGDKETAEDEAGKATLKSMARARGKQGAGDDVDEDLRRAKLRDAKRKKGMFAQVLEFDEVDPIALFGMGNAMLTLGEYEGAVDHLRRALKVDKRNSPVYLATGKALEKLDRFDEAIEVYRDGLEVASAQGDLMPLREMEHRLLLLGASKKKAG